MFDYTNTLNILSMGLLVIIIILLLTNTLLKKREELRFLTIFLNIFSVILLVSLLINKQFYLGEIIVLIMFFTFSVLFCVLNYTKNVKKKIENKDINFFVRFLFIILFIICFVSISLNFKELYFNKIEFINSDEKTSIVVNENEEQKQNILKLEKNQLFTYLLNIITYYISILILIYHFNKGDNDLNEK